MSYFLLYALSNRNREKYRGRLDQQKLRKYCRWNKNCLNEIKVNFQGCIKRVSGGHFVKVKRRFLLNHKLNMWRLFNYYHLLWPTIVWVHCGLLWIQPRSFSFWSLFRFWEEVGCRSATEFGGWGFESSTSVWDQWTYWKSAARIRGNLLRTNGSSPQIGQDWTDQLCPETKSWNLSYQKLHKSLCLSKTTLKF